MMAVSAVRRLPDGVRWVSKSARVGTARSVHVLSSALLDDYTSTLHEIREVGFVTFAGRQFRPYVRAAIDQFSPKRRTLTERLLEKIRGRHR